MTTAQQTTVVERDLARAYDASEYHRNPARFVDLLARLKDTQPTMNDRGDEAAKHAQ